MKQIQKQLTEIVWDDTRRGHLKQGWVHPNKPKTWSPCLFLTCNRRLSGDPVKPGRCQYPAAGVITLTCVVEAKEEWAGDGKWKHPDDSNHDRDPALRAVAGIIQHWHCYCCVPAVWRYKPSLLLFCQCWQTLWEITPSYCGWKPGPAGEYRASQVSRLSRMSAVPVLESMRLGSA